MRINNNIMAINTHRQYGINNANIAKSMEKLSSGYRVNRAGDDAAGLAISEKMRAQIRGLNMASKNSQDAISLVQTAEGALQESHAILQRMRELAVQSASDTNETSIDRGALDAEFQALISEIDDTAAKTKFNNMGLIDGSFAKLKLDAGTTMVFGYNATGNALIDFVPNDALADDTYTLTAAGTSFSLAGTVTGTATIGDAELKAGVHTVSFRDGDGNTMGTFTYYLKDDVADAAALSTALGLGANNEIQTAADKDPMIIQTGANQGDELSINIEAMDAELLRIDKSSIAVGADARKAITQVDNAINRVSTQRAKLGALQNRLQHKINNLDVSAENLQAAESRIRDVDMAKEMTTFTRNNILSQASSAMLAQANSAPQGVLQLLR